MTATHITIITGASRGLGLGMATQLLASGHRLLCISRQINAALAHPQCEQWQADLADPLPVAHRLRAWLDALKISGDAGHVQSVSLINNAAFLADPFDLSAGKPEQMAPVIRVGLEAPLLLTQAFLAATSNWPNLAKVERKVLQISSGNGRRALAGSASYSAVKAGLDHSARVVALEEAARPSGHGAKVVSLAPGVIDTDMQVQLRSADPKLFAAQTMFANYHATGQLWSPEVAAAKVLSFLQRADFGENPVADVRDA